MGFEPTIPATARQQTYVLDHAATGIGSNKSLYAKGDKKHTIRLHKINSKYFLHT
jgi:hypothetical protein